MTNITRTITFTSATCTMFNQSTRVVEEHAISVLGECHTEAEFTKALKTGDTFSGMEPLEGGMYSYLGSIYMLCMVEKLKIETERYSMSVADFIRNAEQI